MKDAKELYGFTGTLVGVVDVHPGQLTQDALGVIRRNAWQASDESDSDFNFYYVCDDFWENVDQDEYDNLNPKVKLELEQFIEFMEYNKCWWVRFI